MTLALIAAVARNGIIGGGNQLLWRLSSDLKRFKALRMGKPLIVGRKTFDSIGMPLPGRRMIVVTRDSRWRHDGVETAASVEAALALVADAPEIMIGGGGEIYAQTIRAADRLYLTEVDLAPEGDARFPTIDPAVWREVTRETGVRGPKDEAGFTFVEWGRR
jgi:dihydrofolate reductase